MDKLPGFLTALATLGVALTWIFRSWQQRKQRDSRFSAYPKPDATQASVLDVEILYVATTRAGDENERLAIRGLAFRGAGRVKVQADGVLLRVAGEEASFIPSSAIVRCGTADHTIDRGVEPGGLIVISWHPLDGNRPGQLIVDTYLRARYPEDKPNIVMAIETLIDPNGVGNHTVVDPGE